MHPMLCIGCSLKKLGYLPLLETVLESSYLSSGPPPISSMHNNKERNKQPPTRCGMSDGSIICVLQTANGQMHRLALMAADPPGFSDTLLLYNHLLRHIQVFRPMIHIICFGLDHVAVVVHEASEQTKFNVLSLSSQYPYLGLHQRRGGGSKGDFGWSTPGSRAEDC